MQYGVCCTPESAPMAAEAGYAFIEWRVRSLLMPGEDADAFDAALEQVRAGGLPCPVLNCFLPNELPVTGPDADLAALESYVTTAFERAPAAGVEKIVFGSGGARRVPDGFSRADANAQIVAFCRMLAPIAESHGVTVVVEPLNQAECNVLTTVGESAALVREVDHPGLRLLVDGYHLLKDDDSLADVVANGDILEHVHLATVPSRVYPGAEPCDLGPFFKALAGAGYAGRVSVEARVQDAATEFPRALALMEGWEQQAAS